jgi:hypothetical protein
VLWEGWDRFARLDGPPLGKAAQGAVLFLYFQWMMSIVLPWCLLAIALGWSAWWWVPLVFVLFVGEGYLIADWQRVRAGEVILRRRRMMHPAIRWICGLFLGALLPVLIAGSLYTASQHRYGVCVALLVGLWACHEQLIETILG